MNITSQTRISAVLKENPEAIEAIAALNPNFEKLRNPVLRRVLAPRVTIAEAARIGGVDITDFFKTLERIGFTRNEKAGESFECDSQVFKNMPEAAVTLRANDFLERGEDPLRVIQSTLLEMKPGEILEIVANFAPSPLVRLMKKNGYDVEMIHHGELWHTFITKPAIKGFKTEYKTGGASVDFHQKLEFFKNRITQIDVRHLPMPGPMIRILESAEMLEPGTALYIHHKRIPQHLLPELQERGFAWRIFDENGDVKMLVWRND